MKKQIRFTRKLESAIEILSGERMADSSDEAFRQALRSGTLKPLQLYQALKVMRYMWQAKHRYWQYKPIHMKSIRRIFAIVRRIDDDNFLTESEEQ